MKNAIGLGLHGAYAKNFIKLIILKAEYSGSTRYIAIKDVKIDEHGEVVYIDTFLPPAGPTAYDIAQIKTIVKQKAFAFGKDLIDRNCLAPIRSATQFRSHENADKIFEFEGDARFDISSFKFTLKHLGFICELMAGKKSLDEIKKAYNAEVTNELLGTELTNPFIVEALRRYQEDICRIKKDLQNSIDEYTAEEKKRYDAAVAQFENEAYEREQNLKKSLVAAIGEDFSYCCNKIC